MVRKGPSTKRGDARSDGRSDVKLPSSGQGNRKVDIAWGQKHNNKGEFELIGDDEFGIPFGAKWRWCFLQEDLDLSEFVNHFENPCTGTSYIRDREGRYVLDAENQVLFRPCMRPAIKGSDVCPTHGGKLPQTKLAARRRIEAASDLVANRLLDIALDVNTDPKTAVQAATQLLDRAGIKGGIDIDVSVPGWQQMLKDMFEEAANAEG